MRPTPCLLAALLFAVSSHAGACRMAPPGQLIDADGQVAQAHDVVLAKVVGWAPADTGDIPIDFTVIQRLAGATSGDFVITGTLNADEHGDARATHAAPAFWERGGGRAVNGADCMIHPTFVMGATYLVFRDGPTTKRSYERIDLDMFGRPDPSDKWLAYVTGKLRQRQ